MLTGTAASMFQQPYNKSQSVREAPWMFTMGLRFPARKRVQTSISKCKVSIHQSQLQCVISRGCLARQSHGFPPAHVLLLHMLYKITVVAHIYIYMYMYCIYSEVVLMSMTYICFAQHPFFHKRLCLMGLGRGHGGHVNWLPCKDNSHILKTDAVSDCIFKCQRNICQHPGIQSMKITLFNVLEPDEATKLFCDMVPATYMQMPGLSAITSSGWNKKTNYLWTLMRYAISNMQNHHLWMQVVRAPPCSNI